MVRLGEWDISKNDTVTEDIEIKRFVSHPEYFTDGKIKLNDIAIVHLVRDVDFTGKMEKQMEFWRYKMWKTFLIVDCFL